MGVRHVFNRDLLQVPDPDKRLIPRLQRRQLLWSFPEAVALSLIPILVTPHAFLSMLF